MELQIDAHFASILLNLMSEPSTAASKISKFYWKDSGDVLLWAHNR